MSDAAMQAYYARDLERDRLAAGVGRVEFVRTIEVIGRTLPAPPATVADIGGGPGRYTDWLVDRGHRVVHRDLVGAHVEQVRRRHGGAVDAAVGDARQLDLPDDGADAVLLLGPLYHLSERADRVRALGEAARVVRGDGPVHVAVISRWSARLHGIVSLRQYEQYPQVLDVIDEVERTGVMPPIIDGGFTGYEHTVEEVRDEVAAAGLALHSLVGLEGMSYALADLDDRLADDRDREILLAALRATEAVPELLGVSAHLLATCRRDG
jgi:SAM-dependent methyltransferase